ncbi:MAG: hypothetical protein KA319_05185 [Ferruginibacter sp.]|nr:hypothetical protein [Ferruginibacter sp.]
MSQNLKDKMLNYPEAPPKGIWDSIAFELDKEVNNNSVPVAKKLEAYEVTPPSFIWEKIEEELDKDGAKIIELKPKTKVFSFYKLAAAASVLLLITTSIFIFTNNKKTEVEQPIASKTNTTTNNNNTASVTPNTKSNTTALPTSDTQEKNIVNKTTVATKKDVSTKVEEEIIATNPSMDLATNPFENKTEKLVAKNGDVPENIDLVSTPNTYLTITGPNGQSIKISSKFSKQLGLFTESDPDKMENIDFIIKESAMWRNKIASWRKKMTTTDVSPSMYNFMDIIELSEKIKTDKKNKIRY